MDRVPAGKQRRDAAPSTQKVETATTKVEAALASREEADKLRRRLLKMIVENEQKRRSTPSPSQV
jgi:membrane protein YdbS with pleckstrin-like domain